VELTNKLKNKGIVMNILSIGISHKTADIKTREQFSLREDERALLLSELKNNPYVVEIFILSTCNRTEIYTNMIEQCPEILFDALFKVKKIKDQDKYKQYFYTFIDNDAVKHLFRVAAGLDSLVIGEKQILGQIKVAESLSRKWGAFNKDFNILLNLTMRTGKKVRTETHIDCGGSSISWAAIKTAQERLGSLKEKSVLIVGAGKMGKLTANQLANQGIGKTYVVNRNHEKAMAVSSEFGGKAVSFWDMKTYLTKVDVCICSADAPHYIIEKDLIERVMSVRQKRKLLCIDISVPRNINPEVAGIKGISLLAVDDLDKVVEENMENRYLAVSQAEGIVNKKLAEFNEKLNKTYQVEQKRSYCFVS